MKKDIKFHRVENVYMVAQPSEEQGNEPFKVLLINKNDFPLTNVFITSKGYGEKDEDQEKTSTLRHFFEEIPANDFVEVETLIPEVFHLFNEYWISYYIDKNIYDKKFIFVPGSLRKENFTWVDMIQTEGVLHN